jgi:hypothetical protein
LPKGPGLITVKVNSGELVETAFPFEDDDWDSLEKETEIDIDEVPSAAEVRVGEKLRVLWFVRTMSSGEYAELSSRAQNVRPSCLPRSVEWESM